MPTTKHQPPPASDKILSLQDVQTLNKSFSESFEKVLKATAAAHGQAPALAPTNSISLEMLSSLSKMGILNSFNK